MIRLSLNVSQSSLVNLKRLPSRLQSSSLTMMAHLVTTMMRNKLFAELLIVLEVHATVQAFNSCTSRPDDQAKDGLVAEERNDDDEEQIICGTPYRSRGSCAYYSADI